MKIDNKELKYLNDTQTIIKKEIKLVTDITNNYMQEINQAKKEFYNNKAEYKKIEISSKISEINHNVNYTNRRIENIKQLEKSFNSPYFGRIDFNNEKIYIGMKSIISDDKNYVYDWRAPVSSMYYNYEIGNSEYDSKQGLVKGNISLKRQYKIKNGELIRIIDTSSNIDDDFLQEILSNSNEKMKNIVSTIQKDQNKIIRNSNDKFIIVQGGAGSGKTSVALHRIAYLLYKDTNLKSNNILILSPNDVFTEYISNVLPELGESNVKNITFSKFISNILPKVKNIENIPNFINRTYHNINEDVKYKLSERFIDDIDLFLEDYINNIIFKKSIKINNRLISSFELNNYFHRDYKNITLKERFDQLIIFICNRLGVSITNNKTKIKSLIAEDVNFNVDYINLYQSFIKTKLKTSYINYEDSLGLLYFYIRVNDCPVFYTYKHVIIDEAQDYTMSQYKILKRIFRNSSFTILGDINQAILPGYKYDNLNVLSKIFINANYLSLNKTYRCSKEIIEYSNKILNITNNVCMRNQLGVNVEFINQLDDKLLEKNDIIKRIAIITYDDNRSVEAAKLINKKANIIKTEKDCIDNDIVIIPAYLSKGLEFDKVIIYKGSDYTENDKNLYYVATTRAQHKLVINEEPIFMNK